MAKVGALVELDAVVLRRIDEIAAVLGRSRDEVIEDSVRRGLAAQVLGQVLARVRSRSSLTEDEATCLAYAELKLARSSNDGEGDPGDVES